MKVRSFGLLAAALVGAIAGAASAATVSYVAPTNTELNPDDIKGTGKGVVLGLLSVDVNGSNQTIGSTAEAGSTGWNGTNLTFSSEAEFSGGSQIFDTNHFYARSVAELSSVGITKDNFALIFQPNQTGHDPATDSIYMTEFTVTFYRANGTILDTGTYVANPSPQGFVGVGQGTSGYVWNVTDISSSFFGNAGNYVGMIVHNANPFYNADDGSDNFFVGKATDVAPVPLPPAAWAGLIVLAGLGVARWRKTSMM